MRKKDEIIQAISEKDRKGKVYIHPVISPETTAKYISAFSNGNGGDMVLGIYDDGINLHIKKSKFSIPLEEAIKLLNINISCIVNEFDYNGALLHYMSIDKSKELVKAQGIPYLVNENGVLVEMKVSKVFLSYSHADKDLADLVEESLDKQNDISVSRDINVNDYRDNLDEFMKTIRQHDFIVSIVTKKYLMSLNCMYEITESMKDSNFSEKLLFIVVDKEDVQYYKGNNVYDMEAGIYDADKRLDYVIYWNEKDRQMTEKLKSADLPYEYITEYTIDKRKLVSIIPSTSEFMNILKDKIGSTFNQIQKDDFKKLKDVIKGE
ncbi:toll/interleukin-1 receptor domain-containing protein [Planococcus sp. ISL-109]|uniref:TIR domain-containing protein n=1 Tax=Planococcus sp. ISL-109 TaxID=2819166 RepID=UPI001BE8884E|nr:toll/interleukin-1 receptor domain-containing protein [Planococcus sp. ISL-109]MBT2583176.1 TIR domain-containing protein [Planococcus sp. ISL-109]